ncbi:PP2C family protein-serine/threonine phosphatase [Amycolatopsis rifamycinica]|uniref:Phosphatase n=1 Tax=Amycolatopsis rifamycinica TaxID=287986 RepID=A0A066TSD4_9PSEU|nr:PP2C family protein-serine/threonine phosphatase [Amycolatopsis rifamycinica]KDN16447.1 phosphatase [Amycolatopsis rifamycinica]
MATTEEEQRHRLVQCFARADLTVEQLWIRYFALGGAMDLFELDAYLNAAMSLPGVQRDMLAHALNERLDELIGRDRVPYTRTIRQAHPVSGPLAALVDLLEGAHRAPPERLPSLMDAAGRSLGLRVGVYLADYAQQTLLPVRGDRGSIDIDSTPAGQAFRRGDVVITGEAGDARLWAPLLDGVERLGVLEAEPTDGTDPHDPILRDQCRWLAYLFGHLVTITTKYGDGLDRVRRREHRGPLTELLWTALPPLTAATETVTIAAATEPAYDVTSDVFDYALSETAVSFAIFDAGTHEPAGTLAAAVALSAYRAARRDGRELDDQARAVDEAVGSLGGGTVCGVIGRFDVATGRLAHVAAGHHGPVLLRDGTMNEPPADCPAPPFGGPVERSTAEQQLRRSDVVVLYTDGVTGARDPDGHAFGFAGLARVARREVPARLLPEAVRRITQAVLAHGKGSLADDASVLLLRPFGDGRSSEWF